jgi:DNA processing protein
VGARTFLALLERFGEPRGVFDCGRGELAACGLAEETQTYLKNPDWKAVDQVFAWLQDARNHVLLLHDPAYPRLVKELSDAPPVLYVRGDPAVLSRAQLAMVGSRNPTPAGVENAHQFARHLGDVGLTITSGLALGVDAASHRGALAVQAQTIAIAGTGLDRVYPSAHRELAHEIAERGALVSEFPLGTAPVAKNFPRRNRIISGLSLGVLVVEAAPSSGSLITARLAAEQGREVFAIPGSIHNPLARGCHALIRQGAKLVETANDVLEELRAFSAARPAAAAESAGNVAHGMDVEAANLLNHMGFDPMPVDHLVERSGLTTEAVSSMLLLLELRGYVCSTAGGQYMRLGKRV